MLVRLKPAAQLSPKLSQRDLETMIERKKSQPTQVRTRSSHQTFNKFYMFFCFLTINE